MRYLSSAIIASIVCWIGLFSRLGLSAFQPDRLAVEIILGSIGTIVIVLGALPPFLASRWLAKRLHVSSIYYDAGCGAVAGFMFGRSCFHYCQTSQRLVCRTLRSGMATTRAL